MHQQPLADKHARSALIFVIDNRIADDGAQEIAEAIKGMKNLKNLGLGSACQPLIEYSSVNFFFIHPPR